MAHYPYCFSVQGLAFAAKLGWQAEERVNPQPVLLDIRLYFPEPPSCMEDDNGSFIDYDALSAGVIAHAVSREFRLIEYMANDLLSYMRAFVDQAGASQVRIWMKLTKAKPAVSYTMGGAAFTLSDLPSGATVVVE